MEQERSRGADPFRQLYKEEALRVYGTALKALGDHGAARGLTQQVFARLYAAIYDPEGEPFEPIAFIDEQTDRGILAGLKRRGREDRFRPHGYLRRYKAAVKAEAKRAEEEEARRADGGAEAGEEARRAAEAAGDAPENRPEPEHRNAFKKAPEDGQAAGADEQAAPAEGPAPREGARKGHRKAAADNAGPEEPPKQTGERPPFMERYRDRVKRQRAEERARRAAERAAEAAAVDGGSFLRLAKERYKGVFPDIEETAKERCAREEGPVEQPLLDKALRYVMAPVLGAVILWAALGVLMGLGVLPYTDLGHQAFDRLLFPIFFLN